MLAVQVMNIRKIQAFGWSFRYTVLGLASQVKQLIHGKTELPICAAAGDTAILQRPEKN